MAVSKQSPLRNITLQGSAECVGPEVIPTAIVSGRSRDKINDFVGPVSENLWVAGAHGYDIVGPAGSDIECQPAASYRDALRAAATYTAKPLITEPNSIKHNSKMKRQITVESKVLLQSSSTQ